MKPDAVREAVAALRCRLDDIRDERHFPAHMLDVHDEMLSVLDGIEHVTGIDSRTGEACRSVAQALKQAFQEADPDATHRFDWADFGDYKLTDKGQAVVDALIRRLGLAEDYVEFADRRYQDGYTDGRRSAALDSRAGEDVRPNSWAATPDEVRERAQLLADVELHLKSSRIFITTREKMHPCGVELHDELLGRVTAAIDSIGKAKGHD